MSMWFNERFLAATLKGGVNPIQSFAFIIPYPSKTSKLKVTLVRCNGPICFYGAPPILIPFGAFLYTLYTFFAEKYDAIILLEDFLILCITILPIKYALRQLKEMLCASQRKCFCGNTRAGAC